MAVETRPILAGPDQMAEYNVPGKPIGGGRSCLTFCGNHDHINGQIFYAAMPFPGCGGCAGGLQTLGGYTVQLEWSDAANACR